MGIVQVKRLEGSSHFDRVVDVHAYLLMFVNAELVLKFTKYTSVSSFGWMFFLVWFADCTFLKTFCADQFSLVFPASRRFCLTMADSPKLAVLRDFEHLMQSVRLMHSMTTR